MDHGVVLGLALGVGAPGAAERAAGHEYYRPYAAAVVDRHVLQLHDKAAHLDGVLRAGDDGVLHALGQVYELGRVAGYADQQVLVILRMLLSGSQGLGFYAVELDVEGSQGEEGLDHGSQVCLSSLCLYHVRVYPQVEKGSAGVDLLVDLGRGFHRGERCGCVCTYIRGNAFAGRVAVLPAVRGSSEDAAHRDVVGDTHEGCEERRAEYVLVLMDLFVEVVGHLERDPVDGVVVVAVFRACLGFFPEIFVTDPVGFEGFDQCFHVADLVFEYQFPDRFEGVGDYGQAYACDDRSYVVLGAASAEVFAAVHAVLYAG